MLAPWAASDARRVHPARCAGTERGAVKRYFAFTLRLAAKRGLGVVASRGERVRSSCWRRGPPATLVVCIPSGVRVPSVAL